MTYQWAVIGAGPAGIAAVGKLLDHSVKPIDIVWIDPNFTVGDFGQFWQNVPSNTKAELFLKFLNASDAFNFKNSEQHFDLKTAPPNKSCDLRLMVEPLQWITHHLKNSVHVIQDMAEHISMVKRTWRVRCKNSHVMAKNVILAIGAESLNLPFSSPSLSVIPLHDAIDSQRIKSHCDATDTVAVFGSSHSAMLVLRNLMELPVKKVINFYRSQLRYAVHQDNWILFDDSGLKGPTAEWARTNLHDELPSHLQRIYSDDKNISQYLPECNKVIYAVGFKRRSQLIIEGMEHINYIEQTGIIAPGLFGFGIAFPEAKHNPLGILEYRVGLWKFMDYLHRIMPIWLNYSL